MDRQSLLLLNLCCQCAITVFWLMTNHDRVHLRLRQVLVTVCFTHAIYFCMQQWNESGSSQFFEGM